MGEIEKNKKIKEKNHPFILLNGCRLHRCRRYKCIRTLWTELKLLLESRSHPGYGSISIRLQRSCTASGRKLS